MELAYPNFVGMPLPLGTQNIVAWLHNLFQTDICAMDIVWLVSAPYGRPYQLAGSLFRSTCQGYLHDTVKNLAKASPVLAQP